MTSMMSNGGQEDVRAERLSISDRFANLSGLTKTGSSADSIPPPKVSRSSRGGIPISRFHDLSIGIFQRCENTAECHESQDNLVDSSGARIYCASGS